jgi:hypothetical protein
MMTGTTASYRHIPQCRTWSNRLLGEMVQWGTRRCFKETLPSRTTGNLLFEGETKLFNDRVRENFSRHPLYFRLRLVL